MKYSAIFLLSIIIASPSIAEDFSLFQKSVVGEVILDATDYCAWKADEYNSKEAGTAAIERGFVETFDFSGEDFVVLDSSKLACGVGDSGSCGSAGCTIWIIGPTEQTVRLGKLVNIPEGFDEEGKRTLYCGNEVDDWEGCVDIRTLFK